MAIRILHIFDHSLPLQSGYVYRSNAILDQQLARGWEPCALTGPRQHSGALTEEMVQQRLFYRTPDPPQWVQKIPLLRELWDIGAMERRITQVVSLLKPDILHAHSPLLNGEAALRVAARYGLPVVYEIRALWEDAAVDHGVCQPWGVRYRVTRALESRVMRRASFVTTLCAALRDELVARGIEAHKVAIIPNGVDADAFRVHEDTHDQPVPCPELVGHEVLGFIGSFYAYEGLLLLLEAMPTIIQQRPKARLLLVGGGPQEETIKKRVVELGLQGVVHWPGRVPHEHIDRYYRMVDLLVYPRLPMRLTDLTTPLKPLEAMAMGKTLLASDVGGHRELINHGHNGFLFPAGSPSQLANEAVRLLAANELRQQTGQAARAWVRTTRSWSGIVQNYEPIYQHLVRGRDQDHA